MRILLTVAWLCPLVVAAQLNVMVFPVKIVGQKAVVPLAMKNNFTETIQSARAVAFLFDADGKMLGQSTKWAIGGDGNKPGLTAGSTNAFNFVINTAKPLTHATAKITFNRIILENGKFADPNKDVRIQTAKQ